MSTTSYRFVDGKLTEFLTVECPGGDLIYRRSGLGNGGWMPVTADELAATGSAIQMHPTYPTGWSLNPAAVPKEPTDLHEFPIVDGKVDSHDRE